MDQLTYLAKAIKLIEEPVDDLSACLQQLKDGESLLREKLNKLKAELAFEQDDSEICQEFGIKKETA